MDVSDAKRLRELERENTELKNIVADQALDIRMLRDVNSKKSGEPDGAPTLRDVLTERVWGQRTTRLSGDADEPIELSLCR